MRAFVFPGQGSQFIGMGKDIADAFPDARAVFAEIDDALSQNLFKLMTAGQESELNLTENTQPALMAVSMAIMAVLTKQGGIKLNNAVSYMAGHSLGEYCALTAAGAFDIATTARLLKLRGQSMQKAVPVGVGAMAAILGLNFNDVKEITSKATAQANNNETVESANDNSDGQVVISGHVGAVNIAMQMATERGAKRAVLLPVSAPFHCSLMKPAADAMAITLNNTTINAPIVPIVANVTASEVSDPSTIKTLLVDQITGTVRWRESVTWMKEHGVSEMFEIGAGKVLSGLIKRIEKDVLTESVGTPEQIDALINKLQ